MIPVLLLVLVMPWGLMTDGERTWFSCGLKRGANAAMWDVLRGFTIRLAFLSAVWLLGSFSLTDSLY